MTVLNSKKTIKLNPFTGELLYDHPKDSMLDLIKKIQSANKAFIDWKNASLQSRLEFLEKIIQIYTNKKNEIILSESLDQGLSLNFTETANYQIGLKTLNQFKAEIEALPIEKNKIFSANGAVAVVLSWNLSNRLLIESVISAWLAGNTVLVKVSSQAISTAVFWQGVLSEARIPENTIQFIVTDESECKKILITHPGIKAVSISGKLKTCADILKSQSTISEKQFKKIQIKSGSKNSCLALGEPTEKTIHQVLETFLIGQGQMVWNSSRLFILEKHQLQWQQGIQDALNQLKCSESPQDNSMWGPIIKDSDRSQYDHYLQQATADQAKFLVSNAITKDRTNFLKPVFTYDMSNCSELQQDQLSVPIYILSSVKYGFDIAKFSNVSYYGHTANVFSETEISDKLVNQLDVGLVSLNQWSVYKTCNMSAIKQSAFGTQGHQIFGEFNSNVKIIS